MDKILETPFTVYRNRFNRSYSCCCKEVRWLIRFSTRNKAAGTSWTSQSGFLVKLLQIFLSAGQLTMTRTCRADRTKGSSHQVTHCCLWIGRCVSLVFYVFVDSLKTFRPSDNCISCSEREEHIFFDMLWGKSELIIIHTQQCVWMWNECLSTRHQFPEVLTDFMKQHLAARGNTDSLRFEVESDLHSSWKRYSDIMF